MARQEHTGICHICGEYKKLTYEHIPPEAAFNSQRRKMSTVKELMENKKDNRAPQYSSTPSPTPLALPS